jgi:coenzyme Q-binding protein COQ10
VTAVFLEVRKHLPFRPADLHSLVTDVRRYPDFIPWVKSLSLRLEEEGADGWVGVASALVGWRAFTERFETRVTSRPGDGTVSVRLVHGPFKVLENDWLFEPGPNGEGTALRFRIRYQFKNPILQAVAGANRELAANRIMGAFIQEAHKRYPVPASRPG